MYAKYPGLGQAEVQALISRLHGLCLTVSVYGGIWS
jgi:hypothetical protein